MAFSFSADEIFEIAERIEINGSSFYNKAADKTTTPAHKELFQELADQEMSHYETFSEFRSSLAKSERDLALSDPDDESKMYLNAFADSEIFADEDVDYSSFESILKSAIGREKTSILFYYGIRDLVSAAEGKDKIDLIINEEKKHYTMLLKQLNKK